MTESEDRFERAMHDTYEKKVAVVVERLRDLADQVAWEGKSREANQYTPNQSDDIDAAQRVVHDVAWGIANLSLDSLITWAATADDAERQAIQAREPE